MAGQGMAWRGGEDVGWSTSSLPFGMAFERESPAANGRRERATDGVPRA